ncbi:ferredoxin [Mycobacterium sp. 852014-52144_SCH5372336]|uniref:ferredoxin n=1 Tax=Mycobacterium sp. 852014-52144_SCH5372336 TaxID=1834115 RepID=UPI0007FD8543|nr:ferredoxin [Mycobacterium sp. 852014-52144_SCH5372336]OBB72573.1 ferredoxin [Mycobacterium sp. 852014-52144_SCH5372336]
MTVRQDNRLADAPMTSVTCRLCAASVLVRKSTWEQTSVQWDSESTARCHQRRDADAIHAHDGRPFLVCFELRDSIEEAARCGALPIVDETA